MLIDKTSSTGSKHIKDKQRILPSQFQTQTWISDVVPDCHTMSKDGLATTGSHHNALTAENQVTALRQRLDSDFIASDLQWTLFVAAAQSFRYDSQLSPYPSRYVLTAPSVTGDRFDIDAMLSLIRAVPALRSIDWAELQKQPDVVDLLHWVLCEHGADTVRIQSVDAAEHAAILAKVACDDLTVRPTHVFRVDGGVGSGLAEERFRSHLTKYDGDADGRQQLRSTLFAFHGSRLESFHSISAHGLQQHLCKTALFGDGIYLSSEMHVSLPFSPISSGWSGSELGTDLSCMAVCEFVDHEVHLKRRVTERRRDQFPEKYFVITNNDIVRVRYLLVFGSASTPKRLLPPSAGANQSAGPEANVAVTHLQIPPPQRPGRIRSLIVNNKAVFTVLMYVLVLLFVGFINSRSGVYWRQRIWDRVESWLEERELDWLNDANAHRWPPTAATDL